MFPSNRVQYDHLRRSIVELCDGEPLHGQVGAFVNEQFAHWLEALSLLGSMLEGILVKAINSTLPVSKEIIFRVLPLLEGRR